MVYLLLIGNMEGEPKTDFVIIDDRDRAIQECQFQRYVNGKSAAVLEVQEVVVVRPE